MMNYPTNRRTLLAATVALVSLGGRIRAAAEEKRLRIYGWGSKDRAERTFKVNDLYAAAHPGVTLSGETLGWGD